ncbi:MAG: tRNA pseudouridine(38-40) synthase TruA [Coriobacteriales bacterium]|jgi:tRNA pseudouridine38-40 synthase|nr:tRNA pseudouridine(38-40) synthase TruA [Coriobacteriales bacterium]
MTTRQPDVNNPSAAFITDRGTAAAGIMGGFTDATSPDDGHNITGFAGVAPVARDDLVHVPVAPAVCDDAVVSLTVAYDGSGFCGFARQPKQLTVQGALEQALATLYRRPVETVGAGRTDAGVHALGQVVSFSLSASELAARPLTRLIAALNAITPEPLVVRFAEERPAGFSARFSALEREYRYRLYTRAEPPLFLAPYVWWIPLDHPLDVNAMRRAAPLLLGEQDFRSFCVAKSAVGKTTIRRLNELFLFGHQHLGEHCIVIQVKGNAFLHSMVRVIAGTLVEVGLRRREPAWVAEVLAARDRRAAGPTAPAQGLTFWCVRY